MHRRYNNKYDKNIPKCIPSKMPIDLELEPDINLCISKPKIHIFNHARCRCKKEHTGSCSSSRSRSSSDSCSRSRSDSCSSVKSESSVSSKKSGCSCNYRRGRTRHRDCKKKDYKDTKSYKIEKCKKKIPITADINIDNKINNIINIKIK